MKLNATALRVPLGITIAILLFFAVIHGPGRGISLVPADHSTIKILGPLQSAVYVLYLTALYFLFSRPRLAVVLLGLGVLGRGAMELQFSAAKTLVDSMSTIPLVSIVLVAIPYLITWVMPGLIFAERLRIFQRSKTSGKLLSEVRSK